MEMFPDFKAKLSDFPGKTCRSCKHRERWECGNSVFQYCGVRVSGRTSNGKLKIKCKDPACRFYEDK